MNRFVVMREYSGHTAKKVLMQQLSREFVNERDAENWLRFTKSEYMKQRSARSCRFYIMEIRLVVDNDNIT